MFLNWIETAKELVIRQNKEWVEILTGWESSNSYSIFDEQGYKRADIFERSKGLFDNLLKQFWGSHRGFEAIILNTNNTAAIRFQRSAYLFFSSLTVIDEQEVALGHVKRRFGIIFKKYDLIDKDMKVFACIKSPIWAIWTFRVYLPRESTPAASISKQWSGLLKEAFTDTDNFKLSFGTHMWSKNERCVLLAAAIAIDFDFFENNNKRD
jgi:hypothetical protein